MTMWSFVATIAAAAMLPQGVLGHGWMSDPASRHVCNRAWAQFPLGNGVRKEGFCGFEPFEDPVNGPCNIQRTYQQGGTFELDYGITANHGGFIRCRICDDPDNLSEACFDENVLLTTDGYDRWYLRGDDAPTDGPTRGEFWQSEWQLPEGLTCDHCVMSCSWFTAQHCSIPCDEEMCGPLYSDRRNPYGRRGSDFQYKPCPDEWQSRTTGDRDPQVFTNCADVAIQGDGTPPAPPPPADGTPSAEEQMEMGMEEIDEMGGVSDSGMAGDLMCDDDLVSSALVAINVARESKDYERLTCRDLATGAAANWAYLMAQQGELSSDRAGNCELASFEADCLEVVFRTEPDAAVIDSDAVMDSSLLVTAASDVGVGYFELDGMFWWTIVAGTEGGASVEEEEEMEEDRGFVEDMTEDGEDESGLSAAEQRVIDRQNARIAARVEARQGK